MDEMYAATYAFEGTQWTELQSSGLVRPEDLPANAGRVYWAGNVFSVYGERLAAMGAVQGITALPSALAMLRLAPQLLAQGLAVPAEQALPVYIRDKVAKTTLERSAEKAQAQGLAAALAQSSHG